MDKITKLNSPISISTPANIKPQKTQGVSKPASRNIEYDYSKISGSDHMNKETTPTHSYLSSQNNHYSDSDYKQKKIEEILLEKMLDSDTYSFSNRDKIKHPLDLKYSQREPYQKRSYINLTERCTFKDSINFMKQLFELNKYQPNIENLEQNRMESIQPERTSKVEFKPGKLDCCEWDHKYVYKIEDEQMDEPEEKHYEWFTRHQQYDEDFKDLEAYSDINQTQFDFHALPFDSYSEQDAVTTERKFSTIDEWDNENSNSYS
jgi:hypothetical protein